MKISITVLAILLFPLGAFSGAEIYSCYDSGGQLHVADNLMSLPAECIHQADTNDPQDPGKVNYVPPPVQQNINNLDFDRAVSQEEQLARQRKSKVESLIQRTEQLVATYENAVINRKSALRSKSYGYRDTIILADEHIQNARRGKESLLDELKKSRLTAQKKSELETLLQKIQN